ncbi:PREDICTED: uncharacterized protein LOC108520731 isoform X2 [Rhinopithecus bieti]|uniref:uncharacterized protein LOC108520731 isoform X2 n=1 Tax=Rhinopithecus bieti TaxID=61621 RepID=UPI00083C2990|nr:PREDICTED: uncharacterized protein LOC108520731 isoform X2 [Rhinopithecus bieti]
MGTHRFTRDPGAEGLFQLFQDRAHLFLGQGWICFAGSQGWGDASLAYGLSMPTPHRPCCHLEGMPLSLGLRDAQQQQPARHTLSCLAPPCLTMEVVLRQQLTAPRPGSAWLRSGHLPPCMSHGVNVSPAHSNHLILKNGKDVTSL